MVFDDECDIERHVPKGDTRRHALSHGFHAGQLLLQVFPW